MKWGILGAMPSEVTIIKEHIEDITISHVGKFTFYDGIINGVEVTLSQCGIGKVNAAIVTQIMIDLYDVDCVVNTGIAGAIHHDLKVMDVVVSREVCYHDYDSRHLRDYVPFIDKIEADEALISVAIEAFENIDHGSSCCFSGRIVSGDQFIESSTVKNRITEEFHPMCVEMEGAAVGHTCVANNIPFLIIRTMSDSADENAADSANDFEAVTTKHSSDIVLKMLQNYKQKEIKNGTNC